MKKILLMHQTVATYDAIGNDIRYMTKLLQAEAPVFVYCNFQKAEGYSYVNREEAFVMLSDPENLVIYHHSGYWEEGEQLLRAAAGLPEAAEQGAAWSGAQAASKPMARLIFRYHNVTPPEFFEDYSAFYYKNCRKGRRQTEVFAESFPEAWWLCDSHYNAAELPQVPEQRKLVVHPFHNLELWERVKPDETLLKALKSRKEIKVLFTGRVVPNKGHFGLLAMLEEFRENYGDRMVLYLIGKFDGSVSFYTEELKRRILAAGLEKRVFFIGEVTDETLLSYYLGCDYYVSFSEHEGFGVPLVEAQKLGLPVIAKDAAAVGEVLGEHQLTLGETIGHYSAAVAYLEAHPEVKEELIRQGRMNCESRFDNQKAGEKLLNWIRSTVASDGFAAKA